MSGHADGVIIRYFFDDEGTGLSQVRQCVLDSHGTLYCKQNGVVLVAGTAVSQSIWVLYLTWGVCCC